MATRNSARRRPGCRLVRRSVRQKQRLADAVRDEDHGLLLRLPDAQQLLLHLRARQLVQRAKGSSISRISGSIANARAIATRCCIRRTARAGISSPSRSGAPARSAPGLLASLRFGDALVARPELDVLQGCQPGEQRRLLKDHAALRTPGRSRPSPTRMLPLVGCRKPAIMLTSSCRTRCARQSRRIHLARSGARRPPAPRPGQPRCWFETLGDMVDCDRLAHTAPTPEPERLHPEKIVGLDGLVEKGVRNAYRYEVR